MAADRDYEDRFLAHIGNRDYAGALATARAAFRDDDVDEHTLAWLAGNIYEREMDGGFGLIEDFVQRYPESLHTMRVFLADLFARRGDYDTATAEARRYLRQVQDTGAFKDLADSEVIRDGVARAFMLLTAAYTECGARSYSMRALHAALCHPIAESWRTMVRSEIERLQVELQSDEHKRIDERWEAFFEAGRGVDALVEQCGSTGFEALADRLELLADHFRFDAEFSVGDTERLQVTCRSEDGVHCLA